MSDFELSPRKKEILQCAVEQYIESASPITSGGITSSILDSLSSATIRNELNALEAMGYLKQLHTSSGRVPTTKGYRFFVNELTRECPTQENELGIIKSQFDKRSANLTDLLSKLASLVSDVTDYPTVAYLNGFEKLIINEIKVIPLMTQQALMLIQTNSGILNNTLELEENISEECCIDAGRYMTQKLHGMSIASMMQNIDKIHSEMLGEIQEYGEFFDFVFSTLVNMTKEFNAEKTLQATGSTKLLNNPEYANIDKAKEVLEALHDKGQLKDLFSESDTQDEVEFTIGEENENEAFRDCTIAKAECKINGESIASIGIIGPKRMDYAKISSALKFIVDETKKLALLGQNSNEKPDN